MGHIGLMPQSVNQTSGYRVQGRDEESAQDVIEDALALEEAGVYSLLLETIPAELAQSITERVSVPTIGIGAGVHCDGQVLVFHDVFGINAGRKRKHVRKYADVGDTIIDATRRYVADVQSGSFPGDEESFSPRTVVHKAYENLRDGSLISSGLCSCQAATRPRSHDGRAPRRASFPA